MPAPALPLLCPHCHGPLVHVEGRGAAYCGHCRTATAFTSDGPTPLKAVLPALAAIQSGERLNARRTRLPPPNSSQPCAMRHLGHCGGPMQRAHLLPLHRYREHPLVHHADNVAWLCREHHRLYHKSSEGRDFVTEARREAVPPGGYGRLTVAYVEFVMTRVAPPLRFAALRVGTLLEGRCRKRLERVEDTLEVSLHYRWLYACGLERLADLSGNIYSYEARAYRRPGENGEPGACRSYRIGRKVLLALRDPCGLEVSDTDLRAIMAAWLEARGESRAVIRDALRTERRSKPSPATLSRWVQRGTTWLTAARGMKHQQGSSNPVLEGSQGRASGSSAEALGRKPQRCGLSLKGDMTALTLEATALIGGLLLLTPESSMRFEKMKRKHGKDKEANWGRVTLQVHGPER